MMVAMMVVMNANSSSDARGSGEPLGKTRPPESQSEVLRLVTAIYEVIDENSKLDESVKTLTDSLQRLFDAINRVKLRVDYEGKNFGPYRIYRLRVEDGKLWIYEHVGKHAEYLTPQKCDHRVLAAMLNEKALQQFLEEYIPLLKKETAAYRELAKLATTLAQEAKKE